MTAQSKKLLETGDAKLFRTGALTAVAALVLFSLSVFFITLVA